MIDPNKVVQEALNAVQRKTGGYPTAGGNCLWFTAEVFARVLGINRWVIYSKVIDAPKTADKSRWAVRFEEGAWRLGWAVAVKDFDPAISTEYNQLLGYARPGDILCSSKNFDEAPKSTRTAPDKQGHVGIYVGLVDGVPCVAENTTAKRGKWWGKQSGLRLTPLRQWNTVTSVLRMLW